MTPIPQMTRATETTLMTLNQEANRARAPNQEAARAARTRTLQEPMRPRPRRTTRALAARTNSTLSAPPSWPFWGLWLSSSLPHSPQEIIFNGSHGPFAIYTAGSSWLGRV